jgi:hypothetical protein
MDSHFHGNDNNGQTKLVPANIRLIKYMYKNEDIKKEIVTMKEAKIVAVNSSTTKRKTGKPVLKLVAFVLFGLCLLSPQKADAFVKGALEAYMSSWRVVLMTTRFEMYSDSGSLYFTWIKKIKDMYGARRDWAWDQAGHTTVGMDDAHRTKANDLKLEADQLCQGAFSQIDSIKGKGAGTLSKKQEELIASWDELQGAMATADEDWKTLIVAVEKAREGGSLCSSSSSSSRSPSPNPALLFAEGLDFFCYSPRPPSSNPAPNFISRPNVFTTEDMTASNDDSTREREREEWRREKEEREREREKERGDRVVCIAWEEWRREMDREREKERIEKERIERRDRIRRENRERDRRMDSSSSPSSSISSSSPSSSSSSKPSSGSVFSSSSSSSSSSSPSPFSSSPSSSPLAKEKAEKEAKEKEEKEKEEKEVAEKLERGRLAEEKAEKDAKDKAAAEKERNRLAEKSKKLDLLEKEAEEQKKKKEAKEKEEKEKKEKEEKDKLERERLAKEKAERAYRKAREEELKATGEMEKIEGRIEELVQTKKRELEYEAKEGAKYRRESKLKREKRAAEADERAIDLGQMSEADAEDYRKKLKLRPEDYREKLKLREEDYREKLKLREEIRTMKRDIERLNDASFKSLAKEFDALEKVYPYRIGQGWEKRLKEDLEMAKKYYGKD